MNDWHTGNSSLLPMLEHICQKGGILYLEHFLNGFGIIKYIFCRRKNVDWSTTIKLDVSSPKIVWRLYCVQFDWIVLITITKGRGRDEVVYTPKFYLNTIMIQFLFLCLKFMSYYFWALFITLQCLTSFNKTYMSFFRQIAIQPWLYCK